MVVYYPLFREIYDMMKGIDMTKTKKFMAAMLAVAMLLSIAFAPFKSVKADDGTEMAQVSFVLEEQPDEQPEAEVLSDEAIVSAVNKHCTGLSMLMLKFQADEIAGEKSTYTEALVKRDSDKKKKVIKKTNTSTQPNSSVSSKSDGSTSGSLTYKYNEKFVKDVTEKEYEILCRIVQAEAGDQDVYGRILVANVILNRVNYEKEFPNDIEGVVFEKKQFSPVSNGAYYRVTVDDVTMEAVERALSGEDYSDGALYFFMRSATAKSTASWFDTLTFVCKYGCHEFFKD